MRTITNRIVLLIITSLVSLSAQTVVWMENKVYFTGQEPAKMPALYFLNTGNKDIPAGEELTIEIPAGFPARWDTAATVQFNSRQIHYSADGKQVFIKLSKRVAAQENLLIDKLQLCRFGSEKNRSSLRVYLNGRRLFQDDTPGVLATLQGKNKKFTIMDQIWWGLGNVSFGKIEIVKFNTMLAYSPSYLSGTEAEFILPEITIDLSKKIYAKHGNIVIEFPSNTTVITRDAKLRPQMDASIIQALIAQKEKYGSLNRTANNILEIRIPDGYSSKKPITVTGLKLQYNGDDSEIPSTPLRISHSAYLGNVMITKQTIQSGSMKATLHNTGNINVVANTGVTELPRLDLYFKGRVKPLVPGQKLVLELPPDYPITFEKGETDIQFSGNMAPFFSSNPFYSEGKKLILELKKTIPSGKDLLTITNVGIRVDVGIDSLDSFRQKDRDNRNRKKHRLAILLVSGNTESSRQILSSKINTSFIEISLKDDQSFLVGDRPTQVKPITLRVHSDYEVFHQGDVFYLVLPSKFRGIWDLTQNKVQLSGLSAGKISPNIIVNANTVKFTVLENFSAGVEEEVIISGLRLGRFKDRCKDIYLELKTSENGKSITRANHSWTIDAPEFSSAEDQIVFLKDPSTMSYLLRLNTRSLKDYFYAGKLIYLRIPDKVPLTFDQEYKMLDSRSGYISSSYQYSSPKEIVFRVTINIPNNTALILSGIHFAEATGLTALPDTLQLSLNDRYSYINDEKSIRITPQNDEFNRALYVCNLIHSNFQKGDEVLLELWSEKGTDLYWDVQKENLQFPVNTELIEYVEYVESVDPPPKTLIFHIKKDWDLDQFVAIRGLKVKNNNQKERNGAAYIRLKFDNLYGPQEFLYPIPVQMNTSLPRLMPEQNSLDSKIKAFIEFYDYSDNRVLMEMSGDEKIIPDIKLNNGEAAERHKSPYQQYITYENNIKNALRNKRLDEAEVMADRLIKAGPNSWYGYYYKAMVLRDKEEDMVLAKANFARAKENGYIPSLTYEPVFQGTPDEQMIQDIGEAIRLINANRLIEAEKKLLVHTQMDSLSDNVIAQANYWLSMISYRLQDLAYLGNYGGAAYDHGYSPGMYNEEQSIDDMYSELEIQKDAVAYNADILAPMGSTSDLKLFLVLKDEDGFPLPVEIEDRNLKMSSEERYSRPFEVKEQEIYMIRTKPLKYHLKNLFVGTAGLGLLWLLIL